MTIHNISLTVDDAPLAAEVTADMTLADLLSLHEGCGEGVCGACTVTVDGVPLRACLMLAVQAGGTSVRTVASLAAIEGSDTDELGLTPLQRAVARRRAFQCGWCLPGFLVGTAAFLAGRDSCADADLDAHLLGHLCRCAAGRGQREAIADLLSDRREARP